MNQVERIIEVTLAQRDLGLLEETLQALSQDRRDAEKLLNGNKATVEQRRKAQKDLDALNPRITAVKDRIARKKRYVQEIDHLAAGDAQVRTISGTRTRAEIAITYKRDNGKLISYTRHVQLMRGEWVGRSTITNSLVVYRMPGEAAQHVQANAA